MRNAFSLYRLAVENQEVWGDRAKKLDFRITRAVVNEYFFFKGIDVFFPLITI